MLCREVAESENIELRKGSLEAMLLGNWHIYFFKLEILVRTGRTSQMFKLCSGMNMPSKQFLDECFHCQLSRQSCSNRLQQQRCPTVLPLVLTMLSALLLLPPFSIDNWCLIRSQDQILLLRTTHCSPDSSCTEGILCPLSFLMSSFTFGRYTFKNSSV